MEISFYHISLIFLKEPPDNWPNFFDPPRVQITLAIQEGTIEQSALIVSMENRNLNLSALIFCEKYSDYNKLLRVTAVILKCLCIQNFEI